MLLELDVEDTDLSTRSERVEDAAAHEWLPGQMQADHLVGHLRSSHIASVVSNQSFL